MDCRKSNIRTSLPKIRAIVYRGYYPNPLAESYTARNSFQVLSIIVTGILFIISGATLAILTAAVYVMMVVGMIN